MSRRSNKYPIQFATRNKELAAIHMMAEQLGMDTKDESEVSEYRRMLWTQALVHSASALDWQGRKKVIDHLKACGGTIKTNEWAFIDNAAADRQPLLRKICMVCKSMKVGKAYAEGAAKRQHGIDRKLEMMDERELQLLVGVLERTRKSKEAGK